MKRCWFFTYQERNYVVPQNGKPATAIFYLQKFFKVPSTPEQAKIPFARVNHNKFMVTEEVAYVGTSNWSEDYFVSTGGVSHTINDTDVQAQLQAVFERNWNSSYTIPV